MEKILELAQQHRLELAGDHVIIHGNIPVQNLPSERLFARFGFEPVGLPVGDYQKWSKILDSGSIEDS